MAKHILRLWYLVMLIFLGASITCCRSNASYDSKIAPTYSSIPSLTFGLTPTIKSNKPSKSPQPLSSSTQTPKPILTLLPTIDKLSRQKTIESLLYSNAGCKLPCFWGITPGIATWDEVVRVVAPLGAKIESGSPINLRYDAIVIPAMQDAYSAEIGTGFQFQFTTQNILHWIRIHSQTVTKKDEFSHLWLYYSPQKIIQTFGKPSRVLLSSLPTLIGTREISSYTLWFMYDQDGVKIRYNGVVPFAPIYHFCPRIEKDEDIMDIDIYIQSKEDHTPLEQNDDMFFQLRTPPYKVLTFEEATGKTLDDFFTIFSQSEEQACFDTTRAIWGE